MGVGHFVRLHFAIFLKECGVLKNVAFRQNAIRHVAFCQIENY